MKPKDFFNKHSVFRYDEFYQFMKENGVRQNDAIHRSLSYYHKKGEIISIRRLLYAVNPESNFAKYEINPYLVAAKATNNSIIAYHSALELHGLAYTTFEEIAYLTETNSRGFSFQNQNYRPICYPKSLATKEDKLFAIDTVQKYEISIKVTSLERTLVDILDRPSLAGGWEEIIRSIDHVISIDMEKLVHYVKLLNKSSIASKVGYFLEQLPKYLNFEQKYFDQLLENIPKQPFYIDANTKGKGDGVYIKKWHLIVPRYIIDRQWEEPNVNV